MHFSDNKGLVDGILMLLYTITGVLLASAIISMIVITLNNI